MESTFLPSKVISYSSQYSTRSYNIGSLLNGREIYPEYGDNSSSAVFRYFGELRKHAVVYENATLDCGTHFSDFFILYFDLPVLASHIIVYEVYNPGCISAVFGCRVNKDHIEDLSRAKWARVWTNPKKYDPTISSICEAQAQRCDIDVSLDIEKRVINCICVEFDSRLAPYYTEVDCVELVGKEFDPNFMSLSSTESSVDQIAFDHLAISEHSNNDMANGVKLLDLPDEVLLQILAFLSLKDLTALSGTCRRLFNLSNDCTLYRRMDLRSLWLIIDDTVLNNFSNKFKTHQWDPVSVSFEWCYRLSSYSIELFLVNCPNVKFLNLSNVDNAFLSHFNFSAISQSCPKVESLVLRQHFTHTFDPDLLKGISQLKLFSLESGSVPTAKVPAFRDWICTNRNLTFLSVDSLMPRLDADQTNCLLTLLSKNCPLLESLNICRASVDQRSFICMSEMRCLKALDVGWSFRAETGTLAYNRALCQMLNSKRGHFTTLLFTACRGFNEDSLDCIASTQPNLVALDLLGVTTFMQMANSREVIYTGVDVLKALLKNCTKLVYLDLSYVGALSDKEVAILVALNPRISIKRAHTCKKDELLYQNLLLNPNYGLTDDENASSATSDVSGTALL